MNKKIMKAVLAIAIVFLVAAMPISGMIGSPISRMVRADDAVGVVRNVAPTNLTSKAPSCYPFNILETTTYNSGTSTITFNATIFEPNGDTDAEIVQASCWISIYNDTNVNTHNWSFVWDITTSTGQSFEAGAANDGYFYLADNSTLTTNIVWTVPAGYATGTITVKLYVIDDNSASLYQTDNCTCSAAITVLGVYNFTGLAVDTLTPFYWNFTANPGDPGVAPGTFNVTSGNYTTYAYDEATATPANNYLYSNATARTYSFWLVVQNASTSGQVSFTLNFVGSSFTGPTDTIPIDGVIRWEWYEGASAPGGANDPNETASTTYTPVDADGSYPFTFTNAGDYIWIRYMIDIPPVSADEIYTCAYTVTGS